MLRTLLRIMKRNGFVAGLLLFSLFDPVYPAPVVEDERTLH